VTCIGKGTKTGPEELATFADKVRPKAFQKKCEGQGFEYAMHDECPSAFLPRIDLTWQELHDTRQAMLAQLLTPAYLPFAVAFAVMIGIGLIEAIGLGLGHLDLDGDVGADGHSGVLDWLGLGGELPILIWLTSLLGCFTLAGVAIQQIAEAIHGTPIAWPLAAGGALVSGGILNTLAANGLARIMPGFESTVISTDDLLRQRATLLEGTARRGAPARAKVVDRHGQAHFILVEPHDDADTIASGEIVLIVRRDGARFFALPDRNTFLQSI